MDMVTFVLARGKKVQFLLLEISFIIHYGIAYLWDFVTSGTWMYEDDNGDEDD